MKYELDRQLLNLDGATPIRDPSGEIVTFRTVATIAVVQATDEDPQMKWQAFCIGVKIAQGNGAVDLSPEEAALLKKWIGERMPPVVLGRMYELIDQRE